MELLQDAAARTLAGEDLALVTVIGVKGSAPRHEGARMLVTGHGEIIGTIGGGRVELEVTTAAADVARGAPARRISHHLVRDLAMCCGGSMEFYVEPVRPSLEALRRAMELWSARRPALLITPLDGSGKSIEIVEPLATAPARAPAPELRPAADGRPALWIEPIWPRDRAVLFGAGHMGRAVGPMAAGVGFEVVLCDDNETGALDELGGTAQPWVSRVVESFDIRDIEADVGALGPGDHALIMTRDHAQDQAILEKLLPNQSLAYLGLIGSRGKIGRFKKRIEAKGFFDEARWARLHAPIGLDIGAETPEEIAVAVVAELIAVRRGKQP